MKKFCPNCGRENVDFYKGFCIDCYVKLNVKIKFPKKIVIKRCPSCGRWYYSGEWRAPSYKLLNKIASPRVKSNLYSHKAEAEMIGDGGKVLVTVTGFIDANRNYSVKKTLEIPVEYENRMCDVCFKIRAKAHEARIQLRRAEEFDLVKFASIKKFVKNRVKSLSFKDPEARAFWMEENKDGIDFLFGFFQTADIIVRQIRSKFKVKALKTAKLVGYDASRGKKKYKVTYVVRV